MDLKGKVLKNRVEVKLQRTALNMLEIPTENEADGDSGFDDSSCGSDMGEKHNHDHSPATSVEFSKLTRPRIRHAKPWLLSTKSTSRSKGIHFNDQVPQLGLNLAKLGTDSLWRYCKRFKLASISSNPTKEELVSIVQVHFSSQRVHEEQVIVEFIRAAKRLKSS